MKTVLIKALSLKRVKDTQGKDSFTLISFFARELKGLDRDVET